MAEIQTRPNAAGVDAFIAAQPDAQRRSDCHALVGLMQQATGEPAVLWGPAIVGFGIQVCPYIKRLSDVDVDVLRQIIERCVALMTPRRIPYKVIA